MKIYTAEDLGVLMVEAKKEEREGMVLELLAYAQTEPMTADRSYNKGVRQGILTAVDIIKRRAGSNGIQKLEEFGDKYNNLAMAKINELVDGVNHLRDSMDYLILGKYGTRADKEKP